MEFGLGLSVLWQVAEEYKLKRETLYLTVNYIDRFLAKVPVQRTKLQLVGITCMLIAAYETVKNTEKNCLCDCSAAIGTQ